jgi:hypothetical protein
MLRLTFRASQNGGSVQHKVTLAEYFTTVIDLVVLSPQCLLYRLVGVELTEFNYLTMTPVKCKADCGSSYMLTCCCPLMYVQLLSVILGMSVVARSLATATINLVAYLYSGITPLHLSVSAGLLVAEPNCSQKNTSTSLTSVSSNSL